MAKARLTFETNKCKGCSLCVTVCPKKIIKLDDEQFNARGFHPARVTDEPTCIACAFCALMCPDCIIKVVK